MSINNIDKKINKPKKKKRKEMFLEDYAKENNLDIEISFDYGESPEKDYKSDSQSNSHESKFDDYYLNKKFSKSNFNKLNSTSTNNSSTDDDIKEKKERDCINNKFEKAFIETKNLNTINNEVKEFKLNDNIHNKQNNYLSSYSNPIFLNKKLFTGVRQYYKNIEENNNNNINNRTFHDNRYDKVQMKIFNRNYQNAIMNNYMNNYLNCMTMKIYSYNDYVYRYNLNKYLQKIKENEKSIEEIKSQITLLENQTLRDMLLSKQLDHLIDFIKKKTNISNLDNNNNDIKLSTNLKHPYFYTDHNEEIRVNYILYLIEGLFLEEHLKKDYSLIHMLNRDGYASLTQLEKHPQLINSKINIDLLKPVFLEHRQNEVTETVETFDDILIRNKDWKSIKKKGKLDAKKIEQDLLKEMGNIKHDKMKELMGKKCELAQMQDRLYFGYHVMTQRAKQLQSHFNTINNIYNYQNNNFIFKNNNIYNNYNNNQYRFGY